MREGNPSMLNTQSEEKKRINVSVKRQITIPKRFYDKLGVKKEVICELRGDEIILRNVSPAEDDSGDLLQNLVSRGFEGDRLVQEFQKQKIKSQFVVERVRKSGISVKNKSGKVDEQIKINFGGLKDS